MRDRPNSIRRGSWFTGEAPKIIGFTFSLFVILWLRRPDSLLNAQFWAEDGGLFFREHVLFGFWGTLTRPYSGYLHVIPRILTAVMCLLPVRWIPLGFNTSALLIDAICCGAFFWPVYRKIIASDALRAVSCLVVTATIGAGSELIGTLSNVQWYLCILSTLLLVLPAKKTRVEIGLTVCQVFCAFTTPVTLLFAPFLFWQAWRRPGFFKIRPIVHLIALAVQGVLMRLTFAGTRPPAMRFDSLFLATLSSGLSRCILSPILGAAFVKNSVDVALFTAMALGLMTVTGLGALLINRLLGSPKLRWPLGAAYLGCGSLLAILWGRSLVKDFLTVDGLRHYSAERYFFVGACMFIFCFAMAVDTFTRHRKPVVAGALLVGAFAWGTVQNFPARSFTDLHWKENSAKIEKWIAARDRHEKVEPLSVPINPNLPLLLN